MTHDTPTSVRLGQLVILHRGAAAGPYTVDRIQGSRITLVVPGTPGVVIAHPSELVAF